MTPGALLINVAGARIADEDALYAGVKDGHLGGATLDVWCPRSSLGWFGGP